MITKLEKDRVNTEYFLKFEKPHNLRGREHGLIRAYSSMYDFMINTPTVNLTPKTISDEIQKRLIKLGCTHLEVKGVPEYIDINEGV